MFSSFDTITTLLFGSGAMLFTVPMFKSRWKEALIFTLLCIIGFGGWFASAKNSKLISEMYGLNIQLTSSKNNERLLRGAIIGLNESITQYEADTKKLQSKIDDSQILINELENNPKIEYRDVIVKEIPKECNAKIKWMKNEALSIKDLLK